MSILIETFGVGAALRASTSIFELVEKGKPWERLTIYVAGFGLIFVISVASASVFGYILPQTVDYIAVLVGVFSTIAAGFAGSSFEYRKQNVKSEALYALEERVRSDNSEPQLAWDLARIKLESYLDRNLRQVSSIFYLTLLVMIFGMALICVGVGRSIYAPNATTPAILAALAGVLVQMIGGTFLLVYRSTMAQAKDYVIVLERINAVGMSINILEGIESATELRDTARVQLSSNLLGMYDPRMSTTATPGT